MKLINKLFHNIHIFLLAVIFSFAIIFLIKNPQFFQASVLNLNEINKIKTNQRDIAYKQNTGLLDIFFAQSIEIKPIIITISYDPTISPQRSTATGQAAFSIITTNTGTTTLLLTFSSFVDKESALIIPFSGNNQNIIIEEAYYSHDTTKKNLSVGNLSLLNIHGN